MRCYLCNIISWLMVDSGGVVLDEHAEVVLEQVDGAVMVNEQLCIVHHSHLIIAHILLRISAT